MSIDRTISEFLCKHDFRWKENFNGKSQEKCRVCGKTRTVPEYTPSAVDEINEWADIQLAGD